MSAAGLDPQAVQLIRIALTESRTGRIVRRGRPPLPLWVRPYRLAAQQAHRTVTSYIAANPDSVLPDRR